MERKTGPRVIVCPAKTREDRPVFSCCLRHKGKGARWAYQKRMGIYNECHHWEDQLVGTKLWDRVARIREKLKEGGFFF